MFPNIKESFLLIVRFPFNNISSLFTFNRANGDAVDRVGKLAGIGQIGLVDPDCRMLGLHIYDGFFKVIPIDDKGLLQEAYNIR
jgi:hypothetical protein